MILVYIFIYLLIGFIVSIFVNANEQKDNEYINIFNDNTIVFICIGTLAFISVLLICPFYLIYKKLENKKIKNPFYKKNEIKN